LKFIAYVEGAMPLFEKAGIAADMDDGFVSIANAKGAASFVTACRKLRNWDREARVST
jgi:catalase